MPRIPKQRGHRLNLDMSPATRERLEALRNDTDADTFAEVIRKSLAVYDALFRAQEEGAVVLVQQDGRPDRELLVI